MKLEAMERKFNRNLSNEGRGSISLQKKLADNRLSSRKEKIPDLTDFMNDMFFGSVNTDKKTYNLTGTGSVIVDRNDEDFESSTRSVSSRLTQEWLEEAKQMVASSPPRDCDLPSRLVVSPRFATTQGRLSTSTSDKRRSRSARRNRSMEGFSGEILSKTGKHIRNRSESNLDPPQAKEASPQVQKSFINMIKIPTSPSSNPSPSISPDPTPPSPTSPLGAPPLPLRQSLNRKSRFQTDPSAPLTQPIPTPTNLPAISKRRFKNTSTATNNAPTTILDTELLSPPKHVKESAHRRTISSSTCSVPEMDLLSPPGNLVEWAQRRSLSSSTCRIDRNLQKNNLDEGQLMDKDLKGQNLNLFLKEQRIKIGKIVSGEIRRKAKIVLSGPSNSASSMVAAICYAWLLENKMKADRKGGEGDRSCFELIVPVMNIWREKMWKQHQAAWLFDHVGLDATALLFSNEVDLETFRMTKLIVGEDILRTNVEVGSVCTILTDNYCEDAYDLLQTPVVKELLLAGILLDTQNLNFFPKLSVTRDAEAVQLLLCGSAPNYRNTLFVKLMQDHRDTSFLEVLRHSYGKPLNKSSWDGQAPIEHRIWEKKTSNEVNVNASAGDKYQNDTKDEPIKKVSPISGKPTPPHVQPQTKSPAKETDASHGKNKNFFTKLFGFGSK